LTLLALKILQERLSTLQHHMANPDKRTSWLRKLVSAARSLVTYQTSLPLGCSRVRKILFWLQPLEPLEFPVFEEYRQATLELPTGTDRLYWNRESLRQKDIRLEAINRQFRDRVFDACYEIIDRYAALTDDPPNVASSGLKRKE
jgi:hypothetical protein